MTVYSHSSLRSGMVLAMISHMGFRNEFIQSFRALRKSKGFSLTVVLCLMFGIGGCTAIFSVLNGILLKPLPWKEPHKLVLLWNDAGGTNENELSLSVPEFQDFQAASTAFASLAGFEYGAANHTFSDGAQMLWATHVTPSLFSMLGVQPILGRSFAADEYNSGKSKVVLLSHSLWLESFAGKKEIVGGKIQLDGASHTVLGVMPPEFALPTDYRWSGGTEVWLPINMDLAANDKRKDRRLWVLGRLQDATTPQQAQAQVKNIAARLQKQYPDEYPASGKWSARIVPAEQEVLSKVQTPLLILTAAVIFVFLVSTVNVANLFLIRAESRKTETAIRVALGAGKAQLFLSSFMESLILTTAGAVAGIFAAQWGLHLLLAAVPVNLPRADTIFLDRTVLAVTVAILFVTALFLAVLPVLNCSRNSSMLDVRSNARTLHSSRAGRKIRKGMTIIQIALAFVLITGAGLFIRTLENLMRVDTGYNFENVLSGDVSLPPARYADDTAVVNFFEALQDRVGTMAGVESASITTSVPFWNPASLASLDGLQLESVPDSEQNPVTVAWEFIGDNFSRTTGVNLIEGRLAERTDNDSGEAVAFISESLANRFFPGSSSLGGRIRYNGRGSGEWLKIAGVVNDVRDLGVDVPSGYRVYVPFRQMHRSRGGTSRYFSIVIRTLAEPSSMASSLRSVVRSMDRQLPVGNLKPLKTHLDSSLSRQQFTALLLMVFGGTAFALAAVGTYGVISYSISERTKEFGIRMAVGATPMRIKSNVLGEAVTTGLIGLAFGMIATLCLGGIISSSLYGVKASDAFTYTACAVALMTTVLLASYLPAQRAGSLEIMRILREE